MTKNQLSMSFGVILLTLGYVMAFSIASNKTGNYMSGIAVGFLFGTGVTVASAAIFSKDH